MSDFGERIATLEEKVKNIVESNRTRDSKMEEFVTHDEMQAAFAKGLTKEDVKAAFREVMPTAMNQKQKWFAVNLKSILTFLGGAGGLFLLNKLSEILSKGVP
jgi:hypothetical protein